MRGLLAEFLDLLLPRACAGCGCACPAVLCRACDARLPRLREPCMPGPPRPLDALRAALAFEGEAERWIHRFKYPSGGLAGLDPAPLAVLGERIREAAAGLGEVPDRVVPVPQHPRRLRARGFHPAASLARPVARELGAVLAPTLLVCTRSTESQTGLTRRQRARNVAGAFRATRPAPGCSVLVDDVTTTGATLAEAARALRRAGARRVVAVCAAQTL